MTTKQQHKRSYANYIGSLGGVPSAPANTAEPAITGTAKVGSMLTSTTGSWAGLPAPTLSREWKADGTAISGATGATYSPVAGDVGKTITVTVTATNTEGNATATSAPTAAVAAADVIPANTVAPAITGTAQVGATLTVSNGTWTGSPTPTYTRTWSADGSVIAGATATTYVPVEGDIGKVITATVSATNAAGNASATSAATAAVAAADVAPVNTAVPTITGTAQVGETLTVSNGSWDGSPTPTYTRTWSADDVVIEGATATTYVPVEGDVGKTITATVTATNIAGSASETSAATSAVIAAE